MLDERPVILDAGYYGVSKSFKIKLIMTWNFYFNRNNLTAKWKLLAFYITLLILYNTSILYYIMFDYIIRF